MARKTGRLDVVAALFLILDSTLASYVRGYPLSPLTHRDYLGANTALAVARGFANQEAAPASQCRGGAD